MKGQLKAGAVLSYLALLIGSVISIAYTPVMLRLLGQSEYGLYSLAVSTAGYLAILNFGLGNAVIKYTAQYRALKDEAKCANLYGTFFVMYAGLALLALAGGLYMTFNAGDWFAQSLSGAERMKLERLIGILTVNTAAGIGFGLFSVIILAHERFIFQKVTAILASVAQPLVMLPFLLAGYDSIMMAVVTTAVNAALLAVNMYYCFAKLKIRMAFKRLETGLLKQILVFSFYIFLNLVIEKIYWSTDQIILGVYAGTAAVAVYAIGSSFTGYFSGLSSAISGVFLARVSGMVAMKTDERGLSELFIRIGRLQYIVVSFALGGFIVLGQDFIGLWVGDSYADAYWIALLILAPMIVSLVQGMGGVILQAKSLQGFKSVLSFIIALANVGLSLLLVREWGAIGCAAATAIAFTIGHIGVMNVYYWKRIGIDIPSFWRNIARMSLPLLASILFSVALNDAAPAGTWLLFACKLAAFTAAFVLLIWFAGMNAYERGLFIRPIRAALQYIGMRRRAEISTE